MDLDIKQQVDRGDIQSLRYTFAGALDADPTFALYHEEYNYCKAAGLLEQHRELTPFTQDQSRWNEDYWVNLKLDLKENFSEERMDHMRQVAKVFYADKIQRLLRERSEREEAVRRQDEIRQAARVQEEQRHIQEAAPAASQSSASSGMSKAEQERQRIEQRKKDLADKNRRVEAERRAKEKQRYESQKNPRGGLDSKKWIGIALAAILLLIIIAAAAMSNPQQTENPQEETTQEETTQE